jgi:hypothetical protein
MVRAIINKKWGRRAGNLRLVKTITGEILELLTYDAMRLRRMHQIGFD